MKSKLYTPSTSILQRLEGIYLNDVTQVWKDQKLARLVKLCASNLAGCSYAHGKSLHIAVVLHLLTHQPTTLPKAIEEIDNQRRVCCARCLDDLEFDYISETACVRAPRSHLLAWKLIT